MSVMKQVEKQAKSTEDLGYASWSSSSFCHTCFIKRNLRFFQVKAGCETAVISLLEGQSAGRLGSGCYASRGQDELQTRR